MIDAFSCTQYLQSRHAHKFVGMLKVGFVGEPNRFVFLLSFAAGLMARLRFLRFVKFDTILVHPIKFQNCARWYS